ncbi:hypothetical protein L7F22_046057 [Adiantum nelumboides]|nr:hypothetical protein [Adiantum nelumboides]
MVPEEQPEEEELDEILVPKQILAHKDRKVRGKVARRYLVKFKNYSSMDAKWMEEAELITERINDVSFRLRLPNTWKIHNAFHVSLLKPFRGDVPDDGEPDEQPEVEENEEILVPEQILAHKDTKTKGKVRRRFLVKFKNYPALDAKWMEEEDLADTPQIVKLYLEAFGLA